MSPLSPAVSVCRWDVSKLVRRYESCSEYDSDRVFHLRATRFEVLQMEKDEAVTNEAGVEPPSKG
jgi:hypothetical protein